MDLSFGSEEKAPTPSPQSTSAEFRRRGKSLLAQGRYREAREAFAEALALNPEEAKAWCSLGEANERLGRIDVALHIYREGLRQVSGSRHLLYVRIARLHVRRGEFEPARRALTKALALRPDDAMLAEMLARVRARLLHSPAVETEQDEPDLPPPVESGSPHPEPQLEAAPQSEPIEAALQMEPTAEELATLLEMGELAAFATADDAAAFAPPGDAALLTPSEEADLFAPPLSDAAPVPTDLPDDAFVPRVGAVTSDELLRTPPDAAVAVPPEPAAPQADAARVAPPEPSPEPVPPPPNGPAPLRGGNGHGAPIGRRPEPPPSRESGTRDWMQKLRRLRPRRRPSLGVVARLEDTHPRGGELVLAEVFPPNAVKGEVFRRTFALEDPAQRSVHIKALQGRALDPVGLCRVVLDFEMPVVPAPVGEDSVEILFEALDDDHVRITVNDLVGGGRHESVVQLRED